MSQDLGRVGSDFGGLEDIVYSIHGDVEEVRERGWR